MMQRLTESYSFSLEDFKKIVSSHKITEEEMGKLSGSKLSEGTQSFLEKAGTNLSGKTVWRVPVARYDNINANGRKYEKRLWKRVLDEQKEAYQGNIGLADHPGDDEDGRFRETAVVWLDAGINESSKDDEKIVWGECIFVGPHGRLAEEIMEAGGRVGFSSSGFGELEESDKSTVRWDSYMLERLSDIVLNPSQKVYGKAEMKSTKESIEESVTNTIQEKTMEKATATNKMSPKEIRKFKEDILGWMQKAESVTDLQEKLAELTEILSYFSEDVAPEMKTEVEKQIAETKAKIDIAIKEHGRIKEAFDIETADALKEGIKKVATDTQLFERDATEWKTIATGLQEKLQLLQSVLAVRPTNEAYKTSLEYARNLEAKFQAREAELLNILGVAATDIQKYVEINKNMAVELKSMGSKLATMKEKALKYRDRARALTAKLEEAKAVEQAQKTSRMEAIAEDFTPRYQPQKTPNSIFEGFNEQNDVEEYYEDLVGRHGADITQYEAKIKSCKTLKEAMLLYTRILSGLDRKATSKVTEALDPEDRKRIIEGQTGKKIASQSNFQKRLPAGWN